MDIIADMLKEEEEEVERLTEADIRILKFLAQHPGSSKYDLKKAVSYQQAAIRIPVLLDRGLVEELPEQPSSKQTLPRKPYKLTFKGLLTAFAISDPEERVMEGNREENLILLAIEKYAELFPELNRLLSRLVTECGRENVAKAIIEASKMLLEASIYKFDIKLKGSEGAFEAFIPNEFLRGEYNRDWLLPFIEEEVVNLNFRLNGLIDYLDSSRKISKEELRRFGWPPPGIEILDSITESHKQTDIENHIRWLAEALKVLSNPGTMFTALVFYKLFTKPLEKNPVVEAFSIPAKDGWLVEVRRLG